MAQICRVADYNYKVLPFFDTFLSGEHEGGKMEGCKTPNKVIVQVSY